MKWRKLRFDLKRRKKKKKKKKKRRKLLHPKQRVRDRARKGLALLPNLLTLGNFVCGFWAIVYVGSVEWVDGAPVPSDAFQWAAIAILAAAVFDIFDGRVARLTNSTSDFGGQLDSLADAVSFGVAPGVLVAMLHTAGRYGQAFPFWSRMAWVFGTVYACCAVIRLARFNTETDSHDESSHLKFKGLPSPPAAALIASLVLLHSWLISGRADNRLAWLSPPTNLYEVAAQRILDVLPFVALAIGYMMVSKFRYVHIFNRFLKGRKPAEYLSGSIFLIALVLLLPEVTLVVGSLSFALSGPILSFYDWMNGDSATQPAAAPKQTSSSDDSSVVEQGT